MAQVAKMHERDNEPARTAGMPSTEGAKRDAIAALVDSVTGALALKTQEARKALDRFDETALQHAQRVKMELETLVDSAETLSGETGRMVERLDEIRSTHARLVNTRVAE